MAGEYRERSLPISVIVIDYFRWPLQESWKFDLRCQPNPDVMIRRLREMGVGLVVSTWPAVDYRSGNFQRAREKGYLIRTDRGFRIIMGFQGNTIRFGATSPRAREYVWQKVRQSYCDKGVKISWLDEAEPKYSAYGFGNYRYHMELNMQIGNIYPVMYVKTSFDDVKTEGQENIISLLRCAQVGSQKYGALVWSGDIHSSFAGPRNQVATGLSMRMTGTPW